ncbi:hypothetical protein RhiirA4_467266 [Rhizophagus irregularis]|uniref:Uncharacterized protein n=1 Tax=Rhizophagus irregularis TaxID=588596 RepID=A0A2I1GVJ4_9GLOM|nr:hypothetical protein RhiirA4_467266 [Rhizophagus irregularis]
MEITKFGEFKNSVRAQILLNENFELTRQRGAFGIGISKCFIRWYDAAAGLKTWQERDKWKLVRPNRRRNEGAKDNEYEFIKKIQQSPSQNRQITKVGRNKATTGDKKEEDMPAKSWFNYLTDERKTGEKRPKLESPGVTISKPKDTKKDQKKKKKKEQED